MTRTQALPPLRQLGRGVRGAPGGVEGDSVQEVCEAAHHVQASAGRQGQRGGSGAEKEDVTGGGHSGPRAIQGCHQASARQRHVGADRADV